MLACRPLLLAWILLSVVQSHTWRACTDLLPLDLLTVALPRPGQAPPTQVQMVQSRGSRGLRLTGAPPAALSFSASQIFTNCDGFPAEFSLVATVKVQKLRPKTSEFLFSVVKEVSGSLLLGLRISETRVHLQTRLPGPWSRLTFKDVPLDNNMWHTLVLSVSGQYAALTVDCGLPLELKQVRSFPSTLSTRGSRFFIGSGGRWRGRFSGLLRQLVLLPGSDASPRLCPTSEPGLAELSVPQVLKSTPLQLDQQRPVYPYEAEARVTAGDRPRCSEPELGQLWLDSLRKGLSICDGLMWRTLLQKKDRLDYLEDYQDLYTLSETFDVEIFSIPSEGLFMAAANRDSGPGSAIYRWTNRSFQLYQNISTQQARAWKHFTIKNKNFLVVADIRRAEPELSVIYRWNQRLRRFLRYQTLETHAAQDWEAFQIQNHSFLVVANHRRARDFSHNIHSVIYRWNPETKGCPLWF
ncbi:thrombospondin-type laminin G domain and EAR repeat-containing protein [Austrofundulus limnaeus]|uniref:Thrombospondin-type laminin G domain and EAR repeat-containing protein n=1 Tax=Austrofundulus limnaeus TaxID=52670 RepID=A0A2I4CMQ6_AUSLI|nr:PREDICTED: thrombospondin-type laminin G domain and EAR repeat-containing protein-like [Austrofundulus limnaeus]